MTPKKRNRGPKTFPKFQNIGRRDGSPQGRGRLATEGIFVRVEPSLREWLLDRAAILGVPYTTMCRDVFAVWKELVVAAEDEAGLSLDLPEAREEYARITAPDRFPGYRDALLPRGNRPSHLDGSPLSPTEL